MIKNIIKIGMVSCVSVLSSLTYSAQFLPPEGKKLMSIGQDVDSINNYASVGITPGAVVGYTGINDMAGFESNGDWGAGRNNFVELANTYPDSALILGISFNQQTANVANGVYDNNINRLIDVLVGFDRPVYLRWGYEVDGPWNGHDPNDFKRAWQKIYDMIQQRGAQDNIALVWQVASWCGGTNGGRPFTDWYPDNPNTVDWIGLSYFAPQDCGWSAVNSAADFARNQGKPLFINESSPQRYDISALTYSASVAANDGQPRSAQQIWDEWFSNYFNFIHNTYGDIVKAVTYINADWDNQSRWGPPYREGYWGDSRVESNSLIQNNWTNELNNGNWIHGSANIKCDLGYNPECGGPTPPPTGPTPTPSPTPTPQVGTKFEAEGGAILGSASVYDDNAASGGQGVAYISSVGAGFSLTNMPAASSIRVTYASELNGAISLRVNSADAGNIAFSSTGSWTGNYTSVEFDVNIPGNATVEIFYDNGDAAMNVDFIELISDTATPTPTPTATPTITPMPTPTPTTPTDYSYIVHKPTGFKFYTCSSTHGDPVIAGSASEVNECAQWLRVQNGSFFHLQNRASGKYIRPNSGDNGSVIAVQPNTWTGNWTQWSLEDRGDGYGHLVNRATGKYVYAPVDGEGQNLQQQPSSWRGDFTRWQFAPAN